LATGSHCATPQANSGSTNSHSSGAPVAASVQPIHDANRKRAAPSYRPRRASRMLRRSTLQTSTTLPIRQANST
jgi:hypothetical protein